MASVGGGRIWRRTPGLNRPFPANYRPKWRPDDAIAVAPPAVVRRSGTINRFALAIGALPMLETARIGGDAGALQECSSIGRAPVSKTGGRRFEPCHSCHHFNNLAKSPQQRCPPIVSRVSG